MLLFFFLLSSLRLHLTNTLVWKWIQLNTLTHFVADNCKKKFSHIFCVFFYSMHLLVACSSSTLFWYSLLFFFAIALLDFIHEIIDWQATRLSNSCHSQHKMKMHACVFVCKRADVFVCTLYCHLVVRNTTVCYLKKMAFESFACQYNFNSNHHSTDLIALSLSLLVLLILDWTRKENQKDSQTRFSYLYI